MSTISYGYSLVTEGEPARPLTQDEKRLVLIVAGLLSDDEDSNPEYDRACTEIVCEFLGLSITDNRDGIHESLREIHRQTWSFPTSFDRHADQAVDVVAEGTGSIDRIH